MTAARNFKKFHYVYKIAVSFIQNKLYINGSQFISCNYRYQQRMHM